MDRQIFLTMQITAIFLVLFFLATLAPANNKVVVIPLNSSSGKIPTNTSPCTSAIAGTIRWTGTVFEGCNGAAWIVFSMPFGTVTSAGQVWMDRNLGASRVATSISDSAAYGDLYQWGRLADGHEQRTSPTTTTLSSSNVPGHGNFITSSSSPYDWLFGQNGNLWQGVHGINNPCPAGFRLPTDTEWQTELSTWSSNNSTGAYNSPLKLVPAGTRNHLDGTILGIGLGYYWSATANGSNSGVLHFGNALVASASRAQGFSVRCIKD